MTDARWNVSGRYAVTPYNFVPEVAAGLPRKATICDSTIAEMTYTPAIRPFTLADKLELAEVSNELGTEIIDIIHLTRLTCTTPEQFASIRETISAIAKKGFKAERSMLYSDWWLWTDEQNQERIDRVADAGINLIMFIVGVSPERQRPPFSTMTFQEYQTGAMRWVEYAKKRGVKAGAVLSDFSRQPDLERLVYHLTHAIEHGADRVQLADSAGLLGVRAATYMLRRFKAASRGRIPLNFHVHDNFGSAAVMMVEAALEGCVPTVTINGMGISVEPDLAQVVVTLEALYGIDTGIHMEKLAEASRIVERISGVAVPPHRPVVGDAWYARTTRVAPGQEMAGRPFAPSLVGKAPILVWTEANLTDAAMGAKLKDLGLRAEAADVAKAAGALRARLRSLTDFPIWLTDAEVDAVCRKAVA